LGAATAITDQRTVRSVSQKTAHIPGLLTPIAHLALAITSRSLLSSDGKLEA
jgi:hypothetical protein